MGLSDSGMLGVEVKVVSGRVEVERQQGQG